MTKDLSEEVRVLKAELDELKNGSKTEIDRLLESLDACFESVLKEYDKLLSIPRNYTGKQSMDTFEYVPTANFKSETHTLEDVCAFAEIEWALEPNEVITKKAQVKESITRMSFPLKLNTFLKLAKNKELMEGFFFNARDSVKDKLPEAVEVSSMRGFTFERPGSPGRYFRHFTDEKGNEFLELRAYYIYG